MVGKISRHNFFINYSLDPTSHGFWEQGCGELYVFGKSLVSCSLI